MTGGNITTRTKQSTKPNKKKISLDVQADDESLPSTPMSPAVVSTNNPHQLREMISILQNQVGNLTSSVENLSGKIVTLDSKVLSLEKELVQTKAALAISQITSSNLRNELDRQEQYSRRNCIVFDGVATSKNDGPNEHFNKAKAILADNFPTDDEITTGFDKAHPIGPRIDGKQSFIMRFDKHSKLSTEFTEITEVSKWSHRETISHQNKGSNPTYLSSHC